MKALISLMLLLAAFWVGKKLFLTYQDIEKHSPNGEPASSRQAASSASAALPGLPASLETSLAAAEKQGVSGLRDWLRNYRSFAKDPRLAAIELDYVVLISRQDPAEARRIFDNVKGRTPTFSPIYDRVKRLEKTFQ